MTNPKIAQIATALLLVHQGKRVQIKWPKEGWRACLSVDLPNAIQTLTKGALLRPIPRKGKKAL